MIIVAQLLSLILGMPGISDQTRSRVSQMISLANQTDSFAQSVPAPIMNTLPQTFTTSAPVSGNTTIMQSKAGIAISMKQTGAADPVNGIPFGVFTFKVSVLDANGQTVNGTPIKIEAPGFTKTKTIDTLANKDSKEYYTAFDYVPVKKGTPTVQFTSGALAASYPLEVN